MGREDLQVIKGAYHGFDAGEYAKFIPGVLHTGNCNLLQDEKGVLDEATGKFTPGAGVQPLLVAIKECSTARGFHNGYTGDSAKVAVAAWTAFFKQHLAD